MAPGKGSQRPAAFNPELSRAARTRLGRYGFTDVMHGSQGGAVVLPPEQKDVVVSPTHPRGRASLLECFAADAC